MRIIRTNRTLERRQLFLFILVLQKRYSKFELFQKGRGRWGRWGKKRRLLKKGMHPLPLRLSSTKCRLKIVLTFCRNSRLIESSIVLIFGQNLPIVFRHLPTAFRQLRTVFRHLPIAFRLCLMVFRHLPIAFFSKHAL